MSLTRREFIRQGGCMSLALAMQMPSPAPMQKSSPAPGASRAAPILDPKSLAPFVDPLPVPAVARSNGSRPSPADPKRQLPYYRIEMRQIELKLHRDLRPTRLWGYDSLVPGPTFETRAGHGLLVEWVNMLPRTHLLPIDHNLHGAEASKPDVRAVVHVHGAKAPPDSDGYPESWFEPGKSAVYFYPNTQEAAMLWYHDHAMGISRLNSVAGLSGVFFVRDELEDSLGLPRGKYEIPLVMYDRMLTAAGELFYPVSEKPDSPWVSDFFGNVILVNGKVLPYLDVEPRKYRLRILNASNARLYHLSRSDGQRFHQIGSDQGLLEAPVELESVLLAPAERADLVIDFAGQRGRKMSLRNETVDVMQFRVLDLRADDTSSLPAKLRPITRIAETAAVKTRMLSLAEYSDRAGESMLMLLNGTYWHMPVSERPVIDTVEIWSLINLTDDTHPIHLHLVRFQVLDRRRFDRFTYQTSGVLKYTGEAIPPEPNELGWKDTVRAEPHMVTRIIIRFEGFPGRYVWHCHNLEHEDNEMMRPYEVVPAG